MPTTYVCPSHIRDMLGDAKRRKLARHLANAWAASIQPILKDGDEVLMPDGNGKLLSHQKVGTGQRPVLP